VVSEVFMIREEVKEVCYSEVFMIREAVLWIGRPVFKVHVCV
jgi:hypothetical protein